MSRSSFHLRFYKVPSNPGLHWHLYGLLIIILPFSGSSQEGYKELRRQMVAEQLISRGIKDQPTLRAMGQVERHKFIPQDQRIYAYADRAVYIGRGQTISQPYIVAFMTEKLGPGQLSKVLEIGTGSGYQAAVLAEIADSVFTIEIIKGLADQARNLLINLGYENIQVRSGDGYFGWPEKAPFDAIIVTSAAPEIPPALLDQLKNTGKMIIPVGEQGGVQNLVLVEKKDGIITETKLLLVRFVPFTRN